jgi:hypothetical protein
MGKRKANDAARIHKVSESVVGEPEDIYASLDNRAALTLILGTLERDASGFIKETETTGNVCIIHLILSDGTFVDVMNASRSLLNKNAWQRKLGQIISSSSYGQLEPRPRILAWKLANIRCYRLRPGDVLLDTREQVRGVVVPRIRTGKSKRTRNAAQKRKHRCGSHRVRQRDA